jgi:Leucine-rich repeat (LRR) protein
VPSVIFNAHVPHGSCSSSFLIGNFRAYPFPTLQLGRNNLENIRVDMFSCVGPDGDERGLRKLIYLGLGENGFSSLPSSVGVLADLQFLACQKNGLTELPLSLKSCLQLVELNLSGNQLSSLSADLFGFDSFPSLRHLDLSFNQLTALPVGIWYVGAGSLLHLNFSNNQIEALPPISEVIQEENVAGAEGSTPRIVLQTIQAQSNNISSLPETGWMLLPCLESLCISKNPLKQNGLPVELVQMPSIVEIIIHKTEAENATSLFERPFSNKLFGLITDNDTKLSNAIQTCAQKEYNETKKMSLLNGIISEQSMPNGTSLLKLSDGLLTRIPEDVFTYTKVMELQLQNNHINFLPASISMLVNLKQLRVQDNLLYDLPEEVCNLPKLQGFWAYGNRLTTLPKSIGNLKKLLDLRLDDNNIYELPDTFGDMESLTNLGLRRNRLEFLNPAIGKLGKLTVSSQPSFPYAMPSSCRQWIGLI